MIFKYFSKSIKAIFSEALDFIYPDNIGCIICNKPIKKINTYSMCKSCFNNLHFILDGCVKCGKPIINNILEEQSIDGCSYCLKKTFYFDKAISCIEYGDESKKMVLGLKYNSKTYMSKYIAQIMKEKLSLEIIKFDYILFVPIHKKRLRERGFNQSEKIAKYLSNLIEVPIIDCIDRKSYTKMLYSLSKQDRIKELKNVFVKKINISKIENKNILLVDDIFTTGSTVNEISKVLKLSGVNKVFVITLLTVGNNSYSTP